MNRNKEKSANIKFDRVTAVLGAEASDCDKVMALNLLLGLVL